MADQQSIQHADNPQPGDYWHECFTPIAVVLQVGPFSVSYLHKTKQAGDGWTWDTSEVATKSRKDFQTWLSYGSIPGTWARVTPNWKHWREFADEAMASHGVERPAAQGEAT